MNSPGAHAGMISPCWARRIAAIAYGDRRRRGRSAAISENDQRYVLPLMMAGAGQWRRNFVS